MQPTAIAFSGALPPDVFDRFYLGNIRALDAAGVRLSVGTDAPLGPPVGEGVLQEIELLVRAGLAPARALAGATVIAAAAAGRSDLGRIEPGARADIIAVAGNPLENVAALRDVRLVIAAGRRVR